MERKRSIASISKLLLILPCFCVLAFLQSYFSVISQHLHSLSFRNAGPDHARWVLEVGDVQCDHSHEMYDTCKIRGPTVLDPTTATFFVPDPNMHAVEKIQPYPRKADSIIMPQIKNVTLITGPRGPPCKVQHKVPALVFTAGGYTGNFFQDFCDGFIPLFITVSTVFDDRDFAIVVSENPVWWITKYASLLHVFTKHRIITLKNDNLTHCFPWAHLGLISHKFMIINQTLLPNSKSYLHFRGLLHKAFSRHDQTREKNPFSRPRAIFVSRNGTTGRVLTNQREAIEAMKEVGFEVVIFEPTENTPLHDSYALISPSHALLGVHGAALTHALFLRPGAVFLQIVPIGVEWAADAFFGRAARGLNLEYVEYKIRVEESSLVEMYGKDDSLLKDPFALQKNGWPNGIMDIYLKEQDVKLDMVKFKEHLKQAYKKARDFMLKEGYAFSDV